MLLKHVYNSKVRCGLTSAWWVVMAVWRRLDILIISFTAWPSAVYSFLVFSFT